MDFGLTIVDLLSTPHSGVSRVLD